MRDVWLYPKQFNATTKGNIKIVERAYDEDVRFELDNYLEQIKKLKFALERLDDVDFAYCGPHCDTQRCRSIIDQALEEIE